MSALILGLTLLLAPMVVIALVNLVAAPRLHRLPPEEDGPMVSVLVPARNEARNLRRLLPALARTRYPRLEVLVLDDLSSDETSAVVRGYAAADGRFRLVEGLGPPNGWIGKSWACHQLSYHARGDILIFCDADVAPGPAAVARTVTGLTREGLDALTAFPRHDRGGWFEEALVPLVAKLPIAALLPLPLVSRTRFPSLAAGNGQWFAWRRAAYQAIGRHARVRDDVLEDVRLARIAKRAGLRLGAFIATRDLRVRMYRSPAEAWGGFRKNIYVLAGGADRIALPVLVVHAAVLAGPLLLPLAPGAGPAAWIPLALVVLLRAQAAVLFGDPGRSVLLHPVGVMVSITVLLSSRWRHLRGTVDWKGRTLRPSPSPAPAVSAEMPARASAGKDQA